jgi:AcrR family transcriptional regulator
MSSSGGPAPAEAGRADALRNRGAILDAAVDVLADDPSASLAEVARRAGLGRATLYRHFPSREALRDAIRQEALARAQAALAGAGLDDVPAREGVRRAAAVLVPLGMRFRVLLAEGADVDPDFVAARDVALAPLIGLVARAAAERGDVDGPAVNPAWTGLVLANLLVTAARAADAGVVAPDDAAELVTRTLFDGIG